MMLTRQPQARDLIASDVYKLMRTPEWPTLFAGVKGKLRRDIYVADSDESLLALMEEIVPGGIGAIIATQGEPGELCLLEVMPLPEPLCEVVQVSEKSLVRLLSLRAMLSKEENLLIEHRGQRTHLRVVDRGRAWIL